MNLDRRFDDRLPLETLLCAYVLDRPQRGLAVDISERGYSSTPCSRIRIRRARRWVWNSSCPACLKPFGPQAKPAATPWMTTSTAWACGSRPWRLCTNACCTPTAAACAVSAAVFGPDLRPGAGQRRKGCKGSRQSWERTWMETENRIRPRIGARRFCG